MKQHYCQVCATMEHVREYHMDDACNTPVYLCDSCKRDFYGGFLAGDGNVCVDSENGLRTDSGAREGHV